MKGNSEEEEIDKEEIRGIKSTSREDKESKNKANKMKGKMFFKEENNEDNGD